jgi:hypothetical protein
MIKIDLTNPSITDADIAKEQSIFNEQQLYSLRYSRIISFAILTPWLILFCLFLFVAALAPPFLFKVTIFLNEHTAFFYVTLANVLIALFGILWVKNSKDKQYEDATFQLFRLSPIPESWCVDVHRLCTKYQFVDNYRLGINAMGRDLVRAEYNAIIEWANKQLELSEKEDVRKACTAIHSDGPLSET